MALKSSIRTTASFNGVPAGEFRTFTGGDATWEAIKSVNGAQQIERARTGRKKVGDVTIVREDTGSFDFHALAQAQSVDARVTRQALDADGNPFGRAWTYTGKVMSITPGDGDNEADTDLDDVTVVVSCDGLIS